MPKLYMPRQLNPALYMQLYMNIQGLIGQTVVQVYNFLYKDGYTGLASLILDINIFITFNL